LIVMFSGSMDPCRDDPRVACTGAISPRLKRHVGCCHTTNVTPHEQPFSKFLPKELCINNSGHHSSSFTREISYPHRIINLRKLPSKPFHWSEVRCTFDSKPTSPSFSNSIPPPGAAPRTYRQNSANRGAHGRKCKASKQASAPWGARSNGDGW
jgi:hypothetical protein